MDLSFGTMRTSSRQQEQQLSLEADRVQLLLLILHRMDGVLAGSDLREQQMEEEEQ